jgi:hypothetical protein
MTNPLDSLKSNPSNYNETIQLATIVVQDLRNISAKLRDLAVINPSLSKQLHDIAGEIYNSTK